MNVAAYARVSTQRQAEEQTITQQIERRQAHARTEGWTIMPPHLYLVFYQSESAKLLILRVTGILGRFIFAARFTKPA